MITTLKINIAENPPELQVSAQAFRAAVYAQRDGLLLSAFNYIKSNSNSLEAPYHNLYHTQCVTYYVFFGAKASKLDEWGTTNLTLAALFHDFNHSAGLKTDRENIEDAVSGWREFGLSNRLSQLRLIEVEKLIRCTEYPFRLKPQSPFEEIIRDADLLQITCPQWEEMIYEGLVQELSNTKMNLGQPLEEFRREFAKAYREFWLQAEFHSEWGKSLRAANEGLILKRLNSF